MADYTRLPQLECDTLKVTEIASAGLPKIIKLGSVDFSATSGTAVKLGTVPKGYAICKAWCNVTTAFNSGTADTLKIGTADDDDALMGTSDITTHTKGCYFKDAFMICTADTDIKATLTKTGTAASEGAADVYIVLVQL